MAGEPRLSGESKGRRAVRRCRLGARSVLPDGRPAPRQTGRGCAVGGHAVPFDVRKTERKNRNTRTKQSVPQNVALVRERGRDSQYQSSQLLGVFSLR
jgi:hypothetical protein